MPSKTRPPSIPAAPPFRTDPTLACRTGNADLWFPDSNARGAAKAAKKLCRACPRRDECLAWAVETRQADGIYGAMTATERLNLQSRRSEDL